jgi:hypothetical protein
MSQHSQHESEITGHSELPVDPYTGSDKNQETSNETEDNLALDPVSIPSESANNFSPSPSDAESNSGAESDTQPLAEWAREQHGIPNFSSFLASNTGKANQDWNLAFAAAFSEDSPTYEQAMQSRDKDIWLKAINAEYQSLELQEVLSAPVDLPVGFKPLDTKMVLKRKEQETVNGPRRYKARLCCKGFRQAYGVNYFDTFAPVAAYNAVRIFVSMLASMDYEMDTVDVTTAFLHAPLKEEIYIKLPPSYSNKDKYPGKVLRLLKCLYGLKQSPMEWNAELNNFLISIGFEPTTIDPCIYTHKLKHWYILIYVDDMILAVKTRQEMAELKNSIQERFPCSDKGPISIFLNIHFIRDRKERTIELFQPTKVSKVLKDPHLSPDDLKTVGKLRKTPACNNTVLTAEMSPTSPEEQTRMASKPYLSILGQVLYIAITTRPDIATAVSACGKFSKNPGNDHWLALLRILSYLNGTQDMRLHLGGIAASLVLETFSDADWAGDLDQRKSRSGYVVLLNKNPVIWSSKLQTTVALSSTEAEYIALSAATRDTIWSRILLGELGFEQTSPTTIYEDNQSCIKIAESKKSLPGLKHIDIRHHFIRDRIANKDICLERKDTSEMIADIFTKQLTTTLFEKHRIQLRLIPAKGTFNHS